MPFGAQRRVIPSVSRNLSSAACSTLEVPERGSTRRVAYPQPYNVSSANIGSTLRVKGKAGLRGVYLTPNKTNETSPCLPNLSRSA